MEIAFSTLGCPGWSWEDILITAKDLGFDGIEIRGIGSELYAPSARPFTATNIQSTKERLEKLNIKIAALTSACYLFDKENIADYIKEGKDYIDLANKMDIPYIRVLGDRAPEPGEDVDLNFISDNLILLSEYAEGKNVTILVETNGKLAKSEKIAKLIEITAKRNIGVLWDVHHTYRFFGESPETTFSILKDHIKYIHIKDSIIENNKIKYRMLGYGDVPVKGTLNLLKNNAYAGYVSLEWVKRWCMDLEEPGVVFSHFINYVKDILR